MNIFSLADRNAVITGGTRGIGLAIAEGFLDAGARVTICSRKPHNVAAALDSLSRHADRVRGVTAHVSLPDDRARLLETAVDQFGPVNVLVNNAGTNPYFGPIVDSSEQVWDKTMDVNLKGPYLLSQQVARSMIAQRDGSIINIASVAGLTPLDAQGIYSISKSALIMLTKVMAKELGRHKIRVNCICPGLIKTKLSEALWRDPDSEAAITRLKALGRIGEAPELVGAAVYLASEASSFTSGSVLQVDGGMVL